MHLGYKKTPTTYLQANLYFRGANNTMTHFDYLNTSLGLFNAKKIVVTGVSSGGIAVGLWSNYIYEKAVNKNGVLIIPDSGIFILDFVNPYLNVAPLLLFSISGFQIFFEEQTLPLKECVAKYPTQIQCFMLGKAAEFIKPATFLIMSEYDMYGISVVYNFSCADYYQVPTSFATCNDTEIALIEQYRAKINEAIANFTKFDKNGAWAISCAQHGFFYSNLYIDSEKYVSPFQYRPKTISQALHIFMRGRKRVFFDNVQWPRNRGCNGIKNSLTEESGSSRNPSRRSSYEYSHHH